MTRDGAATGPWQRAQSGSRRYVVTGCAGFIGSHLVETLLESDHEIVGIDSITDYYAREIKERNLAPLLARPGFTFMETDLLETELESLVRGVDGVFHLAAQPGVRGSFGSSFERYVRDNVLATQRVLEAASAAGVRVVLASSSSVYGEALGYPTPEDTMPRPISPYGVTKHACEQLAFTYERTAGANTVVLRYFSVYGPRQRPDMAFARVIEALRRGTSFQVLGDGLQSRDFTYVSDTVEATVAAFEAAPRGAVYNVGGGEEASLLDAIELVEEVAERSVEKLFSATMAGDVHRTCAGTHRIRRELGWEPRIGLAEGLATQVEANAALANAPEATPARS